MRAALCCWLGLSSLIALALPTPAAADGDYYNHVLFDNSLTPSEDYYTEAQQVYPSTLATQEGRIPVETKMFFTPPNALRLEWRSVTLGSWDAEVRAMSIRNRPPDFRGGTLYFWCYAPQGIAAADLPRVRLLDTNLNFTASIQMGTFTKDLPRQQRVQVRIPLSEFTSASIHPFEVQRLHSVYFSQGGTDDKPHTMIIDEIKIDDQTASYSPMQTPTAIRAKGYERHADIRWEAQANKDVQYFVVYRSTNGKDYEPAGIQVPGINRFTDFIGGAREERKL